MIFNLHYLLINVGYSAYFLLGSYMIRYADVSDLEIGFIFMIQPLAVFARPFICARADRLQSHKRLLQLCLLITVLFYLPFITIPILLRYRPQLEEHLLSKRICFWILGISHLLGSFGFTGIRSLGDSLAVNYAKRVNSSFSSYRKFGSIGFGICGFLLGQINQNWLLPDFVPAFIVYVLGMFTLLILMYLWPDEHFRMIARDSATQKTRQPQELPKGREIAKHMWANLIDLVMWRKPAHEEFKLDQSKTNGDKGATIDCFNKQETRKHSLTTRQQAQIFLLLVKRDFRILLFLLLILHCGLVSHAMPFVYTYMGKVCNEGHDCNAASLAGLVMICYCILETTCYMLIDVFRSRINYLVLLEVSLISVAIHYNFFGFLLPHLSPYFFLVESLHGLEYSTCITSEVELADKFASEVELLLPELIKLGIISKKDDTELVKLSLLATMNSLFTLAFDGLGTLIGAFIFGLIIDRYSFTTVWCFIGFLATVGFLAINVVILVGKWFRIAPEITRMRRSQSIN